MNKLSYLKKNHVEDSMIAEHNIEGVAALTNVLANNGKLKKLCLSGYGAIMQQGGSLLQP